MPQDGFTSLMIAAQHDDNDMLQTLTKHGASVNAMPRTAA
jgi:ankyrin repeat protein